MIHSISPPELHLPKNQLLCSENVYVSYVYCCYYVI